MVEGAARLLAGAGEVHVQLAVARLHVGLDHHRLAAHAVIVHAFGERHAALGQLGDAVAQPPLRIAQDAVDGRQHRVQAGLPQQLQHQASALVVGGDLGADIVHAVVGFARVVRDHLQQVQVQLALPHDAHGRQADAFFPNGLQVVRGRAGHGAAHVSKMGDTTVMSGA
ncbi:hypothetical protein G6F65_020397 [Rhizopus arrhizus]|nr:hypothetical protein G6F65_020397 [Rhizopus arrhizus]